MAKTNRETLKGYFGKGKKPDSTQFADLVDSMLNIVDDGFNRSPERGVLLSPLDNKGPVMEIRHNILTDNPAWVISLGENKELHIHRRSEKSSLVTLHADGGIILGDEEKVQVKVNGSIQADAYKSERITGVVSADGKWHSIGKYELTCKAYRIIASYGKNQYSTYATKKIIAIDCFGEYKKILGRWCWGIFDSIKFRWVCNKKGECCLEVRTYKNCGGCNIYYSIIPFLHTNHIEEQ